MLQQNNISNHNAIKSFKSLSLNPFSIVIKPHLKLLILCSFIILSHQRMTTTTSASSSSSTTSSATSTSSASSAIVMSTSWTTTTWPISPTKIIVTTKIQTKSNNSSYHLSISKKKTTKIDCG